MRHNRLLFILAASMLLASCNNSASMGSSLVSGDATDEGDSTSVSSDTSKEVPSVGAWSLTPSDVKPSEAGSYPAPYEVEVDEALGGKVTVECTNVMLNNGTFSENTIQMKKLIGCLYIKTPMKGTLNFELMYKADYQSNDVTGYPSVYCVDSDSAEIYGEPIAYEQTNVDGVINFSVAIDGYAVIWAHETYASYFKSISFVA